MMAADVSGKASGNTKRRHRGPVSSGRAVDRRSPRQGCATPGSWGVSRPGYTGVVPGLLLGCLVLAGWAQEHKAETASIVAEPSRVRVFLSPTLLGSPAPTPDQELDPFGETLANGAFVG